MHNVYYLIASLLIVAADQASKYAVLARLNYHESVHVLPIFSLTLSYNTGAAFSFLDNASGWQHLFFVSLASIISGILLIWLWRLDTNEKLSKLAISCILGGALGNLCDRLQYGYVVDFLHFHWSGWHFAIFNVADSAIFLGACLMLLTLASNNPPSK